MGASAGRQPVNARSCSSFASGSFDAPPLPSPRFASTPRPFSPARNGVSALPAWGRASAPIVSARLASAAGSWGPRVGPRAGRRPASAPAAWPSSGWGAWPSWGWPAWPLPAASAPGAWRARAAWEPPASPNSRAWQESAAWRRPGSSPRRDGGEPRDGIEPGHAAARRAEPPTCAFSLPSTFPPPSSRRSVSSVFLSPLRKEGIGCRSPPRRSREGCREWLMRS
jgi:hypothetical protein